MFKGFNMTITSKEKEKLIYDYHSYGQTLYKKNENKVQEDLDSYIGIEGRIDCSKLIADWFPNLENCHIFLSHSHDDNKLAVSLAGFLHKNFGLETFIDSYLWGYCDELLHKIDEKYCKSLSNSNSYSYESRNYSTSHIHMMLSTALNKMIDTTECVIFLNTDKSIIKTEDIFSAKTKSAWIYSEIITTSLIRENPPKRTYVNKSFNLITENAELDGFKPEYDVDLKHLITLELNDFEEISIFDKPELVLDTLYLNKYINTTK